MRLDYLVILINHDNFLSMAEYTELFCFIFRIIFLPMMGGYNPVVSFAHSSCMFFFYWQRNMEPVVCFTLIILIMYRISVIDLIVFMVNKEIKKMLYYWCDIYSSIKVKRCINKTVNKGVPRELYMFIVCEKHKHFSAWSI